MLVVRARGVRGGCGRRGWRVLRQSAKPVGQESPWSFDVVWPGPAAIAHVGVEGSDDLACRPGVEIQARASQRVADVAGVDVSEPDAGGDELGGEFLCAQRTWGA